MIGVSLEVIRFHCSIRLEVRVQVENVRHKLIVVTASSSNHFGALRQMLRSLRRVAVRVECYDIGLADEEWRSLPQWDGVVYRRFDYAAYPPHMNVAVNAGEYAWKPVIIAEVV